MVLQNKFQSASGKLVGGADKSSFAMGLEGVKYEGPLKLRIPVRTSVVESDGAFSFEIPLPDPDKQAGLRSLMHNIRRAVQTPISLELPPESPQYAGDSQSHSGHF